MRETILIIDTGSSSMRGILFDPAGGQLFTHQIKYTMSVGDDESATMDGHTFSTCLLQICRAASEEIKKQGYTLLAVSLDSQRSSVLAVDEQIHPIYPALMWYDKRCADICTGFDSGTLSRIYQLCGMRLTPVSSAPKMLWMKQHLPDVFERAHKLIGIHDYLLYQMTGELATDASCACRTALMDIRSFQWSDELLEIFQIPASKLISRILTPGSVLAPVSSAFSQATGLPCVPVISAGGDQQACLLGQGSADDDTICVNSGSASYLAIPISVPSFDPEMEVNLSAYYGVFPWVMEASNMGSGTLYQWFNRIFYHEGCDNKDVQKINEEIQHESVGSNGLICFADFAGRGCPDTDPHARGIFAGIGLQHTRASFARALLEGICFDICACISHMRALGVSILKIRSTGGLSNFPVFNQILADISGLPVYVSSNAETTAAGALAAAKRALGLPGALPHCAASLYTPIPENQTVYDDLNHKRSKF